MSFLNFDWQGMLKSHPPTTFPLFWWSVGAFVALLVIALVCRLLARKQKQDRALKLQLRTTSIGLVWFGLGGLVLTWLRSEAIPWLGMSILLPLYGLVIIVWLIWSWLSFRHYHNEFVAKIAAREERWRYLPGQKRHKK